MKPREDPSQLELAQQVGVRRETIVFLEKGKYNPSLRLAHDIDRRCGAGGEALGDDPMKRGVM